MTGLRQRQPRVKDKQYIAWLHELPCVVTGRVGDGVQAAHVRYADVRYGKRWSGKAEKPDDVWCLPVWHGEHARQHSMNENAYWAGLGKDPLALCRLIREVYPDVEAATKIINSQVRRRR